jgi:lipoate-protein ligase A
MEILVTQDTDADRNLALEHELLDEVERGARPPTVRLWVNDPCLVRGPNRARGNGWYREEVARELGVRVLTRTTGGGCVYHDDGNLNWSFYLRRAEGYVGAARLFRPCSETIVAALRTLGIAAEFAAPNRIDAAGRKISGLAARASLGASLVHGTLLVATDLERLNALCIPPPGCPPVVNLRDFDPELTVEKVVGSIAAAVAGIGDEQPRKSSMPIASSPLASHAAG